MKKAIKMYLHSNKDYNNDTFIEKFLDDDPDRYEEVPREFLYTLYEVEFDIEVDTETGKTKILKVNGQELLAKTQKV